MNRVQHTISTLGSQQSIFRPNSLEWLQLSKFRCANTSVNIFLTLKARGVIQTVLESTQNEKIEKEIKSQIYIYQEIPRPLKMSSHFQVAYSFQNFTVFKIIKI